VLNTLDEAVFEDLMTHNYMIANMKGPRRRMREMRENTIAIRADIY
jgi:hypothetical protein